MMGDATCAPCGVWAVVGFTSPCHSHTRDVKTRTAKHHMAKLDAPQLQADIVKAVTSGMTTAQAAAQVGLSRQSVANYCKRHPEFKLELDTARNRRQIVAHHAPRMMPEPDKPYTRQAFLELVWAHANDSESKACAKALGILAEYELGAEVYAARKAAERAGESDGGTQVRRVNVDLPRPGARVIDAEVVES